MPLAQTVIVVCIVVLTAALVSTLFALKRLAFRAESVLHLVEREIRPLASQVEGLAREVRELSHHANEEIARVGVVIRRLEDISERASKLMVALGGLTRAGQIVGVAAGVKKGVDVFVKRLRSTS